MITYLWVRHKRESKREVALADELRRRWQLEEHDRRWYRMESEVPTEYIRGSAMVPYDEVKRTDKLSPKKIMKVHKIDQEIRKDTFVSPRLSYGKWRDRQ